MHFDKWSCGILSKKNLIKRNLIIWFLFFFSIAGKYFDVKFPDGENDNQVCEKLFYKKLNFPPDINKLPDKWQSVYENNGIYVIYRQTDIMLKHLII